MSEVWYTKYGPRRVRFDPPTLREAIIAAQGLTSDLEQQAEIAAALMALPVDEVRAELLLMGPARNSAQIMTSSGPGGAARTVIVERKPSRRPAVATGAPRLGSANWLESGHVPWQDRRPQSSKPRVAQQKARGPVDPTRAC